MHGWIRNPKAPSDLWDGLVLDGAYAGLHPGTNRFVDGSGLENHGTLTGPTWSYYDELGRHGYSRTSGQYITVPYSQNHFLGASGVPFSMCCWVNVAEWSSQSFLDKYQGAVSAKEWVFGATLNKLYAWLFRGNTYYGRTTGVLIAAVNAWHHVAWTHTGAVAASGTNLWLNGVRVDATDFVSGTATAPVDSGQSLNLSRNNDGVGGTGSHSLADPLVFRGVRLAAEQITWLADRSNRLYVPDTRRHFWFPMSRPWLYARTSSVIIGGGIA